MLRRSIPHRQRQRRYRNRRRNDYIDTGSGSDTISGGRGDDRLVAGEGDDTILGGAGVDSVDFSESSVGVNVDLVAKTATGQGTDTISGVEIIYATPDADTIRGNKADNTLYGGGGGADYLFGEGGDDYIYTVGAGSHVNGGHGDDFADINRFWSDADLTFDVQDTQGVTKMKGDGTRVSHVKSFRITGGHGNDRFLAGDGNDELRGDEGHNVLSGRGGDDVLASDGIDKLNGGSGDDMAEIRRSEATMDLDFHFAGESNLTTMNDGTTVIHVENFYFAGGIGDDVFVAGDGADRLFGNAGDDRLVGGAGDDLLGGGEGADRIMGGLGHDTIDVSYFDSTGATYDTVVGFNTAEDVFQLDFVVKKIDTAQSHGTLRSSKFDSDLAAVIKPAKLGVYHAVLFTPDHGDLAGTTFLVVDSNGQAGYQAGADLVMALTSPVQLDALSVDNFTQVLMN